MSQKMDITALQRVLRDRRASLPERLLAAKTAGDYAIVNDELAASLLALARDAAEPAELRANAAISFGAALEAGDTDEFEDPEMVPVSEAVFHEIVESLERLYRDETSPKILRRRALEAAIRAPRDWQQAAVSSAFASGDRDWMLTAVFCMQYIRGFDDLILQALESRDLDIHLEAIRAAGFAELDRAWPHVVKLIEERVKPKALLLAAIESAGSIRPKEAADLLEDLALSHDREVREAAEEALMLIADLNDDPVPNPDEPCPS